MNIAVENRASVVLYNYLRSNCMSNVFAIPANVCPIVPLIFITAGVKFRFVDISTSTHAVDKDKVYKMLKDGSIDSLLFVHAYGCQYVNDSFFKRLKLNGCKYIIEDKCLCIPSLPSEITKSCTDLFLFSTGYAKFVEFGKGGYGFYNGNYTSHQSDDYCYSRKDYDKVFEDIRIALLENNHFSYIPCSWLDFTPFSKNDYFENIERERERIVNHKKLINLIYSEILPIDIQMGQDFTNWRYMVLSNQRDLYLKHIFDAGFFAGKNYPSVSYLYDLSNSPNAEMEATKILNLFNDFRIDEPTAISIANIIRNI